MLPEEPYIFLSFVSGIVVTTLGLVLCLVRIEPNEDNLKIRIARWILVASYFLLSVPDWLNIYGANDSGNKTAVTIVAVSVQALLFTFTIVTMIRHVLSPGRGCLSMWLLLPPDQWRFLSRTH